MIGRSNHYINELAWRACKPWVGSL